MRFDPKDFLRDHQKELDWLEDTVKKGAKATESFLQEQLGHVEKNLANLRINVDEQLRELLEAWQVDLQDETPSQDTKEKEPRSQEHWDQKTFNAKMKRAAQFGSMIVDAPKSVSLAGFAKIFEEVGIATLKDGRERGRSVFVNLTSGDLIVGQVSVGDRTSVQISSEIPLQHRLKPLSCVLTLHTHPREMFEPVRWIEHFSDADIKHLVCHPTSKGEIMLSEGVSFLALRSSRKALPISDAQFETRVAPLRQMARRAEVRTGDYARILTKLMCREFGLTLYFSEPSKRTLFKRVDLDR